MNEERRIEGLRCYGVPGQPHPPRTVHLSDEMGFRCSLCGREFDLDEALAEIGEDELDLWSFGRAAGIVRDTTAERIDLYGMNEMEADLYLSRHYGEVVAYDNYRIGMLTQMVEQGHAKMIHGDYVVFDDFVLAGMRQTAKRRFFKRDLRQFAQYLLDEWEDAGKVRLSVLASVPRTLAAKNYEGRTAGTVEWDEEGKVKISFGPDADAGTFITSMALFFRRMLSPEQQRAAERAFGIRGGIWRPDDEQRYARAYLRWVSEGNAPIPELREAFEVFNSMATPEMLDVELTDEMRAVFRTTLATGV